MKSRARPSRVAPSRAARLAPFEAMADNSVMLEQLRELQQWKTGPEEGRGYGSQHDGGLRGVEGGLGPAPGTSGWSLLSGEQRQMSSKTEEPSGPGAGFGRDFHYTPDLVGGRWGDTFQGERANEKGGAGIQDGRDFSGGGGGWASDDCPDQAEEVVRWGMAASAAAAAGTAMFGSWAAGGSVFMGGMAATGAAGLATYGVCEVSRAWNGQSSIFDFGSSGGDERKKRPREDDTGGGAYVPIGVGHGQTGPIGDTGGGQAGGAGDGRGLESLSGPGPVRQAGKAIAQHTGGQVDAPERERDSGTISFEEMLAQAFFTDPVRG
jgi:hypothetical protein